MSEELTITKERVLEAAGKCPEAKEVLKAMFPSVFEKEYCCDVFKQTVEGGDIQQRGTDRPTFGKSGWFVFHCPFCGIKILTR